MGSTPIEDYALIGDCETAALVSRSGSIDWLCFPRFDSAACFTALLGGRNNGCFQIAPLGPYRSTRRYRPDSLVLETEFVTEQGTVVVIDCMPIRRDSADVARLVVGKRGRVRLRVTLIMRFDYGEAVPWVRRLDDGLLAIAGPDLLRLRTPIELHRDNFTSVADFDVDEGQRVPFHLAWSQSHAPITPPVEVEAAIEETDRHWRAWAAQCNYRGAYRDAVVRSLITLKALTYAPTGGIVAAATTSLPEQLGGVRNWDYRYCWLRDATFTLLALLQAGYQDEALAFEKWLLRAAAGKPEQIQIMYGLAGERRLPEIDLPHLAGYDGSVPVRIGNGASTQRQLDVYGELMDAIHLSRRFDIEYEAPTWAFQQALIHTLGDIWEMVDNGIWEVRGPRRQFTHSKVMAWVAFDRAVRAVERFGLDGPVDHWRKLRAEVHRQVCERGFNTRLNSFVQSYDSDRLDASLLMLPLVGFLPSTDPRVAGTVQAIERTLYRDGFVHRYEAPSEVDGLPGSEGAFLACSFWLADNWVLLGRIGDARHLFERMLSLCNDLGLLSEQYDTTRGRMLGNFPQAFSHVGLINTARNLFEAEKPARERPQG